MGDELEARETPQNWRAYLKSAAETGHVLCWIWQEVMTDEARRWLVRMLVGLVIATAFQVAQPLFVSFVFDGLIQREGKLILFGLASFIACLFLGRLVEFYQAVAREWLLGLSWGALDRRITELFFEKSMGQHIQQSSILSTANIDKGRWRFLDLQAMLLFEGIPSLLALLLSYLMIWYLSVVAGAIVSAVIALYLCWMLFLNRKVIEVCTPIDSEFRRLNRHRLERWEKVERVLTSGKEGEELSHLNLWFDRTIAQDRSFWLWFIRQCTYRGLANIFGLTAVMAYGALLVWLGEWSIGLLYPLYAWSAQVTENIWRIGQVEHQLNWNMPSVRAMIRALSIRPDVIDRPDTVQLVADCPISVAFRQVTHTYPIETNYRGAESGKVPVPVLKDVSFTISPGEKVALIGPSGAGKTTVMRLLLRYMDPEQGEILVNGHPLPEIQRVSWVRCLGYISQQAQVFDGTVRYNLTYAIPELLKEKTTDGELWQLMRLLKIDFGDRLVNGLETLVGRNGIKLSGGQAQRLMIGAAAIKRPRFMIIDEATSHLDSTTERAVQEGLAEVLRAGVSALVVAHRLSTVRELCDKFVVLQNPEVVPPGESQVEAVASSFEELYRLSPTFRQLADDQGVVISTP